MSSASCFRANLSELDELINFDRKDCILRLLIHRCLFTIACIFAIILNIILFRLLALKNAQLAMMKPLFLGCAAMDLLLSVTFILTVPLPVNSYGRTIMFLNGFVVIEDEFLNGVFSGLAAGLYIWGWNMVPIQFAYRFYVIRRGQSPPPLILMIFILLAFGCCGMCLNTAFRVYAFPDAALRDDLQKILWSLGFFVSRNRLGGTADKTAILAFRFYTATIPIFAGSVIILCFQCYVCWFFHRNSRRMSSATKRINFELNCAMLVMGISPAMLNVLPPMMAQIIEPCVPSAGYIMFRSGTLIMQPIISPLATILFATPYRRTVRRWLCGHREWGRRQSQVTALRPTISLPLEHSATFRSYFT